MKTIQQMRELVGNEVAQPLTVEVARNLKGQKIQTIYFGHAHQDDTIEFVVGDVMSELEYYRQLKEECFPNAYGHKNRAEYWESYMTEEQLQVRRQRMILLREDGSRTFMFCDDNGVFCCSDEGRVVYYINGDEA